MLFNSFTFILLFLPVTFSVYFLLIKIRKVLLAKLFLVLASAYFYGWWNFDYVPLIATSILVNFGFASTLTANEKPSTRKKVFVLVLGISFNLGLLGYFKYADFLIQNVNALANTDWNTLNLVLPLAISFFTFQQIAFIVDCSQGKAKNRSFLDYCVFVLFFPQLIAGPIVHHREMMPQFASLKTKLINFENISKGIFLFSMGLFKKVVVADTFSIWATNGFDIATELNVLEAWVTSLCYTMQLYFDFSGYTDMALGIALLFNIRLPKNFNSPYKASSIQDFWRRWHITLSRFLRDYVYIPLGGSRLGNKRTYFGLLTTFLIGGLWHGAGWTFLFWGLLHGIAMITHRVWTRTHLNLPPFLAWLFTFIFINFTWVFFRALDFEAAFKILQGMVGLGAPILADQIATFGIAALFSRIAFDFGGLLMLTTAILICIFGKNSMQRIDNFKPSIRNSAATVIMFVTSFFSLNTYSEFLYFQF